INTKRSPTIRFSTLPRVSESASIPCTPNMPFSARYIVWPELDGPHLLPQGEQERCAVEGRRIDGSGRCNVVVIRDRGGRGWVLFPHGIAGLGVLIADDAACILAARIGARS